MEPDSRPGSVLADSLGAHALQFEKPPAPTHDSAAGTRILVAFFAVVIAVMLARRWIPAVMHGLWPPNRS